MQKEDFNQSTFKMLFKGYVILKTNIFRATFLLHLFGLTKDTIFSMHIQSFHGTYPIMLNVTVGSFFAALFPRFCLQIFFCSSFHFWWFFSLVNIYIYSSLVCTTSLVVIFSPTWSAVEKLKWKQSHQLSWSQFAGQRGKFSHFPGMLFFHPSQTATQLPLSCF